MKKIKLVNKCANRKFSNAYEWAMELKRGLEKDYKLYEKELNNPNFRWMNDLLEAKYYCELINWILDNYFD